ncbi:MAG: acyl carrier protein [Pseudomonadota bacterium]
MRDSVKRDLQSIFREVFDDNSIEIFDEMTANDIEEWDSLMHIQLLLAIERKFNVAFKTEDVMEIQNVGQFVDYLMKKINPK